MPHGQRPHLQERPDHRRGRGRRLRRLHRDAGRQRLDDRSRDISGRGGDPRSSGQRVSHGDVGRRARPQRPGHRLWPPRAVLHRHRAGLRRQSHLRLGSAAGPPRAGPHDGRDPCHQPGLRRSGGVREIGDRRPRARRRAGDVGSPTSHTGRASTGARWGRGLPAGAARGRGATGPIARRHLQGGHGPRDHRAPDVRDVVRHAVLSAGGAGRSDTGHHPPFRHRRFREGDACHPCGRRQGDPLTGRRGGLMSQALFQRLQRELEDFKEQGVYKVLNTLTSPQAPWVEMAGRGRVLVLSSNNYLGMSAEPSVVKAGRDGLDRLGAGTASVRFICGTFDVHQQLESEIARFLGTEAALTYVSCWNANTGLTPTFLGEEDVIISDELNHASVIDGVRATRSGRKVYKHSDMSQLEEHLKASAGARHRLIFTDGVFSMEGDLAKLPDNVALAEKYDAVVAVDDSHGTGVMGATGRGTPEHYGLHGRIDIITSTLGKALGGAAGGFTAGPAAVCDYLTQRSRPQLFSNALPPTVAASALAAVDQLIARPELVRKLRDNTKYFRERVTEAGFKPLAGPTPIVPIIVGETSLAIQMSERMLKEKVFVTGFGYPVVPQGHARIRCQISAAHSRDDLDFAIAAMTKAGRELSILK